MTIPGGLSAMTGMPMGTPKKKKPTHRGKRGGKSSAQHHAEAKKHLANAQSAATPDAASGHLFKALSALNAARSAGGAAANPPQGVSEPNTNQFSPL